MNHGLIMGFMFHCYRARPRCPAHLARSAPVGPRSTVMIESAGFLDGEQLPDELVESSSSP